MMAIDEKSQASKENQTAIYFEKSTQFRVVYADGAWGGVTPRGLIGCAFYNERQPIPQEAAFKADLAKQGFSETVTATKSGIIREVEVQILMNKATAIALRDWLNLNIATLEKIGIDDAKPSS